MAQSSSRGWKKKLLLFLLFGMIALAGIIWYIFTEKFEDTNTVKATVSISATQLLDAFKKDLISANANYKEKIISVTGTITEIEKADTTFNIKMTDSTGAYLIFAMQHQNTSDVRSVHIGEPVSIKGSCSGGSYSKILEIVYVAFKRCIIETKQK